MKYMLDANIVVELLAGTSKTLTDRAGACDEGDLVVSSIAFAEVALRSWNGKRPGMAVLDRMASIIPVMPFDHLAARQFAQLPFRRGSFERLIAAHAIALDLTLVTNNGRDFADVPGLRHENWTL